MSCNAPVSDEVNSAAPLSAGETHIALIVFFWWTQYFHKIIFTQLHVVLYC